MSRLITFIACIAITIHNHFIRTASEWISEVHNTLPRGDTMMAVGSLNNSIYLLGGFFDRQQMTIYDIESDSFVYFRASFLPNTTKCFGEAQFWTQLGTNLYIVDDTDIHNTKISVYNMLTNEFISDFESIPNRVAVSDTLGRACIASIDNSLYINGGITSIPIATTYILNIDTLEWGIAPSMQMARRSHSCIIHPNNKVLYSFGGNNDTNSGMTATIERISTINIHDNIWIYFNKTLSSTGVRGLRSFVAGNNIIIIGGLDAQRQVYDSVHMIDTLDDTVILSDIKLSFPSVYAAAIAIYPMMYSFGGGSFGEDGNNEWWQSMAIVETYTPTVSTTNYPTLSNLSTSIKPVGEDDEMDGLSIRDQAAIGFGIACFFICIGMGIYIWNVYYNKNENEDENQFEKVNDYEDELQTKAGHENDNIVEQNIENGYVENGDNNSIISVEKLLDGNIDNVEENEEKVDRIIASGVESDSY